MTYNQIQHTKAITSMGCESSIYRALRLFVAVIFQSVPHRCPIEIAPILWRGYHGHEVCRVVFFQSPHFFREIKRIISMHKLDVQTKN